MRRSVIISFALAAIIASVDCQNTSGDAGNPSQSNDVANTNTENPEANVLADSQTPNGNRRRRLRPGVKLRRQRKGPENMSTLEPANRANEAEKVVKVTTKRPADPSPIAKSNKPADPSPAAKANKTSGPSPAATVNKPSGTSPAATVNKPSGPSPAVSVNKPSGPSPAVTVNKPSGPSPSAAVNKPSTHSASAAVSKAAENNVAADSGFGNDPFFDLFGTETTTIAPPEPDIPPPEFSVNIPPKKKVLPKVDTRNAVAYDGTPCNETYQNHDTDPTKYKMKYPDGVWETLDCPPNLGTGLVWRQDLCACGEELVPQDPDDWCGQMGFNAHPKNQHKYVRKHHGTNAVMDCAASLVWSQVKCQCIFDSTVKDRPIEIPGDASRTKCKVILRLEFEGNLKNDAEAYHIGTVARKSKLPRIIFRMVPGSTGKVAMIYSQPLEFLAFSGNDFQTQVIYSLRFKISPRHRDKDHFMVLLTDECILNPGGQNRARDPSIRLAFRPNTETFHLQFKTEKMDLDKMINGAQPDKDGWFKVILYFEDHTVTLKVNGNPILSQPDVIGKIPQNRCPLYIAGRGPGFDRSQDFYGYLDNVFLVKDCTFKTSDVKFL